jgi:hypothetical protein
MLRDQQTEIVVGNMNNRCPYTLKRRTLRANGIDFGCFFVEIRLCVVLRLSAV